MERVLKWLLALGYPKRGIDWLSRRRLLVILLLTVAAWVPVLGLLWLAMAILG